MPVPARASRAARRPAPRAPALPAALLTTAILAATCGDDAPDNCPIDRGARSTKIYARGVGLIVDDATRLSTYTLGN